MHHLAALAAGLMLLLPAPRIDAATTPQAPDTSGVAEAQVSVPVARHDPRTPLQLFAAVEAAWLDSDADGLARLVDTTRVRIAIKPGDAPTAATTRNAAAFLFRDRFRLVATRSFGIVRLELSKQGRCRARARWTADWGGRQGVRDVEVLLAAEAVGSRWLLTEVRTED